MGVLARNFEVVPLADVAGKPAANGRTNGNARGDHQQLFVVPASEPSPSAPGAPGALPIKAAEKDRELQTRLSATALKFLNTQLLAAESQLKSAGRAPRRTAQRQALREAKTALRLARLAFRSVELPQPERQAISEHIDSLSARADRNS